MVEMTSLFVSSVLLGAVAVSFVQSIKSSGKIFNVCFLILMLVTGWRQEDIGSNVLCSIERRKSLTEDIFRGEYYLKKPVLFPSSSENERLNWTKNRLLNEFGSHIVSVGTFETLALSGAAPERITLKTYIEHMFLPKKKSRDWYLFDRDQIGARAPGFFKEYTRHNIFSNYTSSPTLTLGHTSTGIPFHFHKDAWLEVLSWQHYFVDLPICYS
jgi:hypothetical protein